MVSLLTIGIITGITYLVKTYAIEEDTESVEDYLEEEEVTVNEDGTVVIHPHPHPPHPPHHPPHMKNPNQVHYHWVRPPNHHFDVPHHRPPLHRPPPYPRPPVNSRYTSVPSSPPLPHSANNSLNNSVNGLSHLNSFQTCSGLNLHTASVQSHAPSTSSVSGQHMQQRSLTNQSPLPRAVTPMTRYRPPQLQAPPQFTYLSNSFINGFPAGGSAGLDRLESRVRGDLGRPLGVAGALPPRPPRPQ
eukprot:Platyproteum_vivax@DN16812_c0_g1_i1.p1